VAQRYDARPGTAYLVRPDQHVAARWRQPQPDAVRGAANRAIGQTAAATSATCPADAA